MPKVVTPEQYNDAARQLLDDPRYSYRLSLPDEVEPTFDGVRSNGSRFEGLKPLFFLINVLEPALRDRKLDYQTWQGQLQAQSYALTAEVYRREAEAANQPAVGEVV